MRRRQVGPGSHRQRTRKDVAVCMHGREPKSQLSSSGMQMREREGSDVLGAREDRGKGSRDASKHPAEVDASQVRQGGLAAFSRRPVMAEFRCMRGWPPRSSAREREREMGHTPRTTTAPVVLKASADHTVAESRRYDLIYFGDGDDRGEVRLKIV